MQTVLALVATLAFGVVLSCQSAGPLWGGIAWGERFKIQVPAYERIVKLGERQTDLASSQRGDRLKRDVKLEFKAPSGVVVPPAHFMVKASDNPVVQRRITAQREAALGDDWIYVMGTPDLGQPTSTEARLEWRLANAHGALRREAMNSNCRLV